jgi:hypothetical protein
MKSDVDFNMYVVQVGDVNFFIVIYVDDLIVVWCVIIRISVCKWRKTFLESSKWKILVICISSLAWKWKRMHNVFFTSTKLGASRRLSNAFAWKIAKLSKCHLMPRQSWRRMWTRMMRWWRFLISKSWDPWCMPCCVIGRIWHTLWAWWINT